MAVKPEDNEILETHCNRLALTLGNLHGATNLVMVLLEALKKGDDSPVYRELMVKLPDALEAHTESLQQVLTDVEKLLYGDENDNQKEES